MVVSFSGSKNSAHNTAAPEKHNNVRNLNNMSCLETDVRTVWLKPEESGSARFGVRYLAIVNFLSVTRRYPSTPIRPSSELPWWDFVACWFVANTFTRKEWRGLGQSQTYYLRVASCAVPPRFFPTLPSMFTSCITPYLWPALKIKVLHLAHKRRFYKILQESGSAMMMVHSSVTFFPPCDTCQYWDLVSKVCLFGWPRIFFLC